MFTEHLAMIGDDDDERFVEAAVGAKRVDQAPDLRVGTTRFRRRTRRLSFAGSATETVRALRTACARRRGGPRQRTGGSAPPAATRARDRRPRIPAAESCPSPRRSGIGRDRSRRSTDRSPARSPSADRARRSRRSRRFETPCRCRISASVQLIVVKVEAAVVAHAVPAGERPRHQRRVRRQGERHHRRRLLESQAGRSPAHRSAASAPQRSDRSPDDPHARCRARRAGDSGGRSVRTAARRRSARRGWIQPAMSRPAPSAAERDPQPQRPPRRADGARRRSASSAVLARSDVGGLRLTSYCPPLICGKLPELLARRPEVGRELQRLVQNTAAPRRPRPWRTRTSPRLKQ